MSADIVLKPYRRIFEMREQVAEMAGKNYGNLKAYRK